MCWQADVPSSCPLLRCGGADCATDVPRRPLALLAAATEGGQRLAFAWHALTGWTHQLAPAISRALQVQLVRDCSDALTADENGSISASTVENGIAVDGMAQACSMCMHVQAQS